MTIRLLIIPEIHRMSINPIDDQKETLYTRNTSDRLGELALCKGRIPDTLDFILIY